MIVADDALLCDAVPAVTRFVISDLRDREPHFTTTARELD